MTCVAFYRTTLKTQVRGIFFLSVLERSHVFWLWTGLKIFGGWFFLKTLKMYGILFPTVQLHERFWFFTFLHFWSTFLF